MTYLVEAHESLWLCGALCLGIHEYVENPTRGYMYMELKTGLKVIST